MQYPCIIGGNAVDRVGLFEVEFAPTGAPVRAEMLRFVGYDSPTLLVEFFEEMERALYELETLHVHTAINLDEAPAWDGTLLFERAAILL